MRRRSIDWRIHWRVSRRGVSFVVTWWLGCSRWAFVPGLVSHLLHTLNGFSVCATPFLPFQQRHLVEECCSRCPGINENAYLCRCVDLAWVAELRKWPVLDDDPMLFCDMVLKVLVVHPIDLVLPGALICSFLLVLRDWYQTPDLPNFDLIKSFNLLFCCSNRCV